MLVDRLSDLPEPLLLNLSLLPTHLAAQTSCLSHRFRLLWSASPSFYFNSTHSFTLARFLVMVDQTLLRRDHSAPLESLFIRCNFLFIPLTSYVRWINHAAYLGIKYLHLTLEYVTSAYLGIKHLHVIFSIKSLESLRITPLRYASYKVFLPTHTVCTCLKSLTLWLRLRVEEPGLTQLIRELPVLEYLELSVICQAELEISSLSVTTLKLECKCSHAMKLCFPKLDVMYLLHPWVNDLEMFQGEVPLVSKAEFRLTHALKEGPCVLWNMLKSVSNAVELKLYLSYTPPRQFEGTYLGYSEMQLCFPRLEYLYVSCTMYHLKLFQEEMPVLRKADIYFFYFTELTPEIRGCLKSIANVVDLKLIIGDDLEYKELGETILRCHEMHEMHLSFPKLEYLEFSCSMCFIKINVSSGDVPVLRKANIHLYYANEEFVPQANSFLKCIANVVDLKLTIQDAWDPCIKNEDKKKIYRQSKLPRNSKNNFRHACFSDLHIRDVKSTVIKLLFGKLSSKKRNT